MTDCDCRSYTPFILLLFIPIMLLVDHHDTPTTSTNPPIDYQKPVNDFVKGVQSYGLTGLLGFGMIVGIITWKSWQSHHKTLATMMLLTIPLYYWYFIDTVPITLAFPFPHMMNQTMVSKP